jgi:hypothetical protein
LGPSLNLLSLKEDPEKDTLETHATGGPLDSLEPPPTDVPTLPSDGAGAVSFACQSSVLRAYQPSRNPRLHLFVLAGEELETYFYSIPQEVPSTPSNEKGTWPLLKLGGTNHEITASASVHSVTKTFRDGLSRILIDGPPRVTVQDLKRYKLFITPESDENDLKVWTGDALGSISVCSDLLEGTETKARAQLPQYLTTKRKLTGISWTQYKFPPKAVGYLKNEEGRFVCFVVYGVDD